MLEQAPPDIDQYIQPSDSALLLSSLSSLSVSHFEIDPASPSKTDEGDPRSVSVRFEFSDNDHFSDSVLEKKFWYRQSKDGWTGLVSEPVRIHWKSPEKDLTGGLLDLVCSAWEAEQKSKANGSAPEKAPKKLSAEHEALKKKIESTGMGGLTFFAWFGFIGPRVSAEENAEAKKLEKETKGKKDAAPPKKTEIEEADEEEAEEEELYMELEIFPDGDDLAIAFAEDLWPGAIKYFSKSLRPLLLS